MPFQCEQARGARRTRARGPGCARNVPSTCRRHAEQLAVPGPERRVQERRKLPRKVVGGNRPAIRILAAANPKLVELAQAQARARRGGRAGRHGARAPISAVSADIRPGYRRRRLARPALDGSASEGGVPPRHASRQTLPGVQGGLPEQGDRVCASSAGAGPMFIAHGGPDEMTAHLGAGAQLTNDADKKIQTRLV